MKSKNLEPVKILAHGLALGQKAELRPALIFIDPASEKQLPIWVEVTDRIRHSFSEVSAESLSAQSIGHLLRETDVKIESVYFNELQDKRQYANVVVNQGGQNKNIRLPAAEAATLAIQLGAKTFTNVDIIDQSRLLYYEWLLKSWTDDSADAKQFEGVH